MEAKSEPKPQRAGTKGNDRKPLSEAQTLSLLTQVGGTCPLCDADLFYAKQGRSYKKYEVAHIYPLHPTAAEAILLKDEEWLNNDLNHEDNLIPLCKACHGKFDKPRTVDEYRNLVGIKRELIKQAKQVELRQQYTIDDDIRHIIKALYTDDFIQDECELEFNPKEVDRKLDRSISVLTKRKIKSYVSSYYVPLKAEFAAMEAKSPHSGELISLQIKSFYLKQKQVSTNQQEVFDNIVGWIDRKCQPRTAEAAEIVASFFIQNCEIFE